MRNKLAWWLTIGWWLATLVVGTLGSSVSTPETRGQPAQPPRPLPPSVQQAGFTAPSVSPLATRSDVDVAQLPPAAQEVYRSARSGAEWLCRAQQPNGRFLAGWVPDLGCPVEGDHF